MDQPDSCVMDAIQSAVREQDTEPFLTSVLRVFQETSCCQLLTGILPVLKTQGCRKHGKRIVLLCLSGLLEDPTLRPSLAPALNTILREVKLGRKLTVRELSKYVAVQMRKKEQRQSLSGLATWCVLHSHFHLALLLAYVMHHSTRRRQSKHQRPVGVELRRSSGRFIAAVLNSPGVDEKLRKSPSGLWCRFLENTLQFFLEEDEAWSFAHVVSTCRNLYTLRCVENCVSRKLPSQHVASLREAVRLTVEKGACNMSFSMACSNYRHLADFALRLLDGPSDSKLQQKTVKRVLDRTIVPHPDKPDLQYAHTCAEAGKVAEKILSIYAFDTAFLKMLIARAACARHFELVEAVLSSVDLTRFRGTVLEYYYDIEFDHSSVMDIVLMGQSCFACSRNDVFGQLKLLRLCVAYGLSSQHRQKEIAIGRPSSSIYDGCEPNLAYFRLLLKSGAISNKTLHTFSNGRSGEYKKSKEITRLIDKAASTVCRLGHLARLELSNAIGFHPGRAGRIEALAAPRFVKNMLGFKDVLDDCKDDGCTMYDTHHQERRRLNAEIIYCAYIILYNTALV
jgi:hypothetical protein